MTFSSIMTQTLFVAFSLAPTDASHLLGILYIDCLLLMAYLTKFSQTTPSAPSTANLYISKTQLSYSSSAPSTMQDAAVVAANCRGRHCWLPLQI